MESGRYSLPEDHDGSPFTLIDRSRLCFEDLPEVANPKQSKQFIVIYKSE
jgi:hypothetical protein